MHKIIECRHESKGMQKWPQSERKGDRLKVGKLLKRKAYRLKDMWQPQKIRTGTNLVVTKSEAKIKYNSRDGKKNDKIASRAVMFEGKHQTIKLQHCAHAKSLYSVSTIVFNPCLKKTHELTYEIFLCSWAWVSCQVWI